MYGGYEVCVLLTSRFDLDDILQFRVSPVLDKIVPDEIKAVIDSVLASVAFS